MWYKKSGLTYSQTHEQGSALWMKKYPVYGHYSTVFIYDINKRWPHSKVTINSGLTVMECLHTALQFYISCMFSYYLFVMNSCGVSKHLSSAFNNIHATICKYHCASVHWVIIELFSFCIYASYMVCCFAPVIKIHEVFLQGTLNFLSFKLLCFVII